MITMMHRAALLLLLALGSCFEHASAAQLLHHSHKKGAALSGDRWIRQDPGPPTDPLGKALEADRNAFSFFSSARDLKQGFVATLTTGDERHWQMYRNFHAAVTAQGLPLITFVLDNSTLLRCNSEFVMPACFHPSKTMEFFKNQSIIAGKRQFVVGGEEFGTEGHAAAVAAKSAVLYLSSTLRRDFLFAETGAWCC